MEITQEQYKHIKCYFREESFITRWGGGGGRLHFHVVGKTFDDPPPPIPLEKNSRPPPQIYDKNVCDPPPPQPAPKHHCVFLTALNEGS